MSLRYPVNIIRRAPGTWVGGRWVPGAETPGQVMATVQPATLADYDLLEPRLEGRRVEAILRMYTSEALNVAAEEAEVSGDLIVWPDGLRDQHYEIMARSPWQSRIIPHYRYLAALLIVPR